MWSLPNWQVSHSFTYHVEQCKLNSFGKMSIIHLKGQDFSKHLWPKCALKRLLFWRLTCGVSGVLSAFSLQCCSRQFSPSTTAVPLSLLKLCPTNDCSLPLCLPRMGTRRCGRLSTPQTRADVVRRCSNPAGDEIKLLGVDGNRVPGWKSGTH